MNRHTVSVSSGLAIALFAFQHVALGMGTPPTLCIPRPDGRRCNNAICPGSGEKCQSVLVRCQKGEGCAVIECDCLLSSACHVRLFGNEGPSCAGNCPQGFECRLRPTGQDDGSVTFRCECVQIPCEPHPNGLRCRTPLCDDEGERCRPRVVECNANGLCHVVECDCQAPEMCRIMVPEDGVLTPGFRFCHRQCPEGSHCEEIRTPLPTGGFRVRCECVPDLCQPRPDGQRCRNFVCPDDDQRCVPRIIVCTPDGDCRVEVCECDPEGACHPQINDDPEGPPVKCIGECPPGFRCELTRELADNGNFVIRCICVPITVECEPNDGGFGCRDAVCPNPEQVCRPTQVLCTADNVCRVVECDCIDRNVCHVELTAAAGPFCVGDCPPGEECTPEVIQTDGGLLVKCRCTPIQEECGPDEMGLRCRDVTCPDRTQTCRPTAVFCDANNVCHIVACECISRDFCHVELTSGAVPPCAGGCPEGQECTREMITVGGGTLFRCHCTPTMAGCEPDDLGLRCRDVMCPDPRQECVPRIVQCVPNAPCRVLACECQDPGVCHIDVTTAGGASCVGGCPPGSQCQQFTITLPDGTVGLRCDCVPGADCGPDPINPSLCRTTPCPRQGEVCVPTKVVCGPEQCSVVACECRDPQSCHIFVGPPEPHCDGFCPPGTVCVRRDVVITSETCALPPDPGPCDGAFPRWFFNPATGQCEMFTYGGCRGNANNFLTREDCEASCPAGGMGFRCDCERSTDRCEPDDSGVRCRPVECPDATEECLPTRAVCGPDGCHVTDCDCRSPNSCHLVLGTANVPDCEGACPMGIPCEPRSTTDPVTGLTTIECRCATTQPECAPEPSSPTGCRPMLCPVRNQRCLPREIHCTPSGGCQVISCECQDEADCHIVQPSPNVMPFCNGDCPPGTMCMIQDLAVGPAESIFRCECVPVPECRPTDDGQRCVDVTCPDATLCVPNRVICELGTRNCHVLDCDCLPQGACRPVLNPPGVDPPVFCDSLCPDGQACREVVTTTPEGVVFECRCEPVTASCAPDSTGNGCVPIMCPDRREECVPTQLICDFPGVNCRVSRCECGNPAACHPDVSSSADGRPPECVGSCPSGIACPPPRRTPQGNQLLVDCVCGP